MDTLTMRVLQLTNTAFASNTYVISSKCNEKVWLIDIVDGHKVLEILDSRQVVSGLFITHAHYDHIYGINDLIRSFSDCVIYISKYGRTGLYCEKTNLSYYHNDSVVYSGTNVKVLYDGDIINLYDNCVLEVIQTPGHNIGSLTYKIGKYLFTGDSFIPGKDVATKLKGGNRKDNESSLVKLRNLIREDTIICPGHGKFGRLSEFEL